MASLVPSPIACIEKERLMKAFTHAVSEFNRISSAQVAALLGGSSPILRFEKDLARAEARKYAAKLAVLIHQQEHGC